MGFYDQDTHSNVEGFILKWTFIAVGVCVVAIFIDKIFILFVSYVTSGKAVEDFGKYIWKALKAVIMGG